MRIIYHCYGSAHSSVIAAAIHLGHLPMDRKPQIQEIMSIADFDASRNDSIGHLYYKGKDEQGIEVFTIGMGAEMTLVKQSIFDMIELCGYEVGKEFLFAEALPHINRLAKTGGALSRRYGLVKIGRFMAAKGICQSYRDLTQFVKQTKNKIKLDKEVD